MFKIAIVDDNPIFLNNETEIASDYLTKKNIEFKIIAFPSGIELLNYSDINSLDLVLLDYEMEGLSGFETAKIIQERSINTSIAFVTVFYEFSREGYKFDAIRYLIKQESTFHKELCDCIDKAIRIKVQKSNNIKSIEFQNNRITIDVGSIVYIQSDKHYLQYYILINNELVCFKKRAKVKQAMQELSDYRMFTIIRTGLIINMKYVKSISNKGIISIVPNENISKVFIVADSNKKSFLSEYMQYLEDKL